MRLLLSILILSTFLCFLVEAATVPADVRKRDTNEGEEKPRNEPRKPRRNNKKPGYRKGRKKQEGLPKYFHEPGGSELGNHYDSRFEHGIQDYVDRKDTQLHMLRAYLTFFHSNRLETWLAHGTLLGWWWNGKMLPWDWDIDTQVSGSTLKYLADHYNGSQYDWLSHDDPPVQRTYLLDINPASVERERGNGNNIIDARWIDTSTGLYIDITGLTETHPDDQPGVWVCKNYHRYRTTDLYPMRETMYEGVTAKVPYAYDRILAEEYNEKAMVLTDYEGHRWDPTVKEWVQKSDAELAIEKEEKEAAKREREEKEKLEKEKEEATKREEEEKKRVEDEKKAAKEREVERIAKEKADKQADIKRQKEQQKMMKASDRIKENAQAIALKQEINGGKEALQGKQAGHVEGSPAEAQSG
ncbi:MAG: hypothetical protein Q9220_002966 [cf. Caloplaca sp. 1 TL-2023]